jgi:antitoxin component of MazEF toxin-antitoxin module
LSKWDNSLGIRLPQAAVKSLMCTGRALDQGRLEIRAAWPGSSLANLLSEITPENQPEDIYFAPWRRGLVSGISQTGELVSVNFVSRQNAEPPWCSVPATREHGSCERLFNYLDIPTPSCRSYKVIPDPAVLLVHP